MSARPPVASPCVKVCCVEPASGLCLGCQRTLPEIARWGTMTEAERAAIMADLPGRAARLDPMWRPAPAAPAAS
jgi:predicted Fe-S protein YdhL (DUF1289 family)